MRSAVRIFAVVSLLLLLVAGLQAQTASGILHGQVSDPSGAVVTQATVTVTAANGQKTTVTTNGKGVYEVKGLAEGKYSLRITAKGFARYDAADVTVASGATPALDISLDVATEEQKVLVEDDTTTVSTDASSNSSTVVIKGKDLDALSDDPDELQSDLEALAGPSAGPNGGQIYIDGFSDGTLPPKSSIREIRVNQNPFSAQYDRLGFGRVEVFTKPGQDKYHGQFQMMANNSVFNSLNPFLAAGTQVPDYHSQQYNGSFGGPINSKASFFFNFERRDINELAIFSAVPCLPGVTSSEPCTMPEITPKPIPSPRMHQEISPRIDYQLTPNNTLTARYEYETSTTANGGVGQFNLESQAYDSSSNQHNFRIVDTQVINSTTINETRFQYVRAHNEQNVLFNSPQIQVRDTFTTGGNNSGNSTDNQSRYELQNYTSKVHGKHFTRFGGVLHVATDNNYSLSNPNGTFIYQGIDTFGSGTPLQFAITTGNPNANVSQADAGVYAEDDWRVKSNITVSYGLRVETQNNVSNHLNFAPRLGFAWGLGHSTAPKTVLRAGFGMFYDRFSRSNVLQIDRTNSSDPQVNQTVQWTGAPTDPPVFTTVPTDLSTFNASRIVYATDPNFKIPYTMQVAVTLERQVTKNAKLTASYIGTRGLHQLVMNDVQSGTAANLTDTYSYMTAGTFKQQQFMVNGTIRAGQYVSLFGWYMLGYANGNTSGGFPSAQSDWVADWGRSPYDVRNRGMIGGSINLPYGFRLNPFIIASSSRPYNIVTGNDPVFNPRPYFSNGCTGIPMGQSVAGVYNTSQGCFSDAPTGLGMVPSDYAQGPAFFATNLRVSKTFGLGPRLGEGSGRTGGGGGGGDHHHGPGMPGGMNIQSMMGGGGSARRYNLTFSASARNLFNNVNEAAPSGDLSSANFGRAVALANFGMYSQSMNRRVDFSVSFNF
jgi:hypothetical protein